MPPPHPMSIERVEKLLDRTIKYQPSSRGDAGYEDLRKQYLGKSWVDVHAATEPAANVAAGAQPAAAERHHQWEHASRMGRWHRWRRCYERIFSRSSLGKRVRL